MIVIYPERQLNNTGKGGWCDSERVSLRVESCALYIWCGTVTQAGPGCQEENSQPAPASGEDCGLNESKVEMATQMVC